MNALFALITPFCTYATILILIITCLSLLLILFSFAFPSFHIWAGPTSSPTLAWAGPTFIGPGTSPSGFIAVD
ncbi:conserved hypothetical protein [Ktedonobacter racemifer DSM 44963]|uniref:Uncharacterized protein n=1 Tax=Ktedonobacter racemifer DSM 44963 TaxID=485913 RepID=D6TZH2_KTERA|nr:conserved hypothetical protein [Ktedonobacter racemifer DSM 44963]